MWRPKLADDIGVRILAMRPKTCNPEEGFLEAAWVASGCVVLRHGDHKINKDNK